MKDAELKVSFPLLKHQRSHVLFILSQPQAGRTAGFLEWYQGAYLQAVVESDGVLGGQNYEQHEIDITQGRCPRLPFHYLGIYEISVDGARAAGSVIDKVAALHREQPAAAAPATWLYYPACEKVGRDPPTKPSMLTLAFANGTAGHEAEFREWYATRHIRHALNIPALTSGQCFERTLFQKPGALEAQFQTIAIYEQIGTPQDILESFASIPLSTFDFPMLDTVRFAESVYRPL